MDYTNVDWREVADNFWYACEHGDADLMQHLVNKYRDAFADPDGEGMEYYDIIEEEEEDG